MKTIDLPDKQAADLVREVADQAAVDLDRLSEPRSFYAIEMRSPRFTILISIRSNDGYAIINDI